MRKRIVRLLWIGLFIASVFLWIAAIYLMFRE
jgi:hypothetical protein